MCNYLFILALLKSFQHAEIIVRTATLADNDNTHDEC